MTGCTSACDSRNYPNWARRVNFEHWSGSRAQKSRGLSEVRALVISAHESCQSPYRSHPASRPLESRTHSLGDPSVLQLLEPPQSRWTLDRDQKDSAPLDSFSAAYFGAAEARLQREAARPAQEWVVEYPKPVERVALGFGGKILLSRAPSAWELSPVKERQRKVMTTDLGAAQNCCAVGQLAQTHPLLTQEN